MTVRLRPQLVETVDLDVAVAAASEIDNNAAQ